MGWTNVFNCEIDPWCRNVLAKHYPEAHQYEDITKTNFTIWRGRVDILTGGFPCQPYSVAGKRLGKEDERHLWPEMLRAIREIYPTYVVGENVSGLLNWNGGMVFNEVQTDLETAGYEVQTFVLLACGVNAPHKRERVWIVANCTGKRFQKSRQTRIREFQAQTSEWIHNRPKQHCSIAANTSRSGCKECNAPGFAARPGYRAGGIITNWSDWPTQPPVLLRNDGFPAGLLRRNNVIKAAGNAVVPQVVYQIFKSIEQTEQLLIP